MTQFCSVTSCERGLVAIYQRIQIGLEPSQTEEGRGGGGQTESCCALNILATPKGYGIYNGIVIASHKAKLTRSSESLPTECIPTRL